MRIPTDLDILPPRPVLFPWISEDFLDLGLNCCWGGGSVEGGSRDEIVPAVTTATTTFQQKFSFGSDDYYDTATGETKQQQRALTPATQPLSPSELSSESVGSTARRSFLLKPLFGHQKAASHGTTTILVLQDDTLTDDIPDVSPSDDESGNSYRTEDEKGKTFLGTHKKQKNAKLVTLADVISEVLRVMMFFLSATGNSQKALVSQKKRKSQKVASR